MPKFQHIFAAADLFPDRLLRIERAALIDVSQHDCFTFPNRSGVGLFLPVIMRNNVVLPAPFGPITPTIPPGGSAKFMSSTSRFSTVGFVHAVRFDHDVAESWSGRNVNLEILAPLLGLLPQQTSYELILALPFA